LAGFEIGSTKLAAFCDERAAQEIRKRLGAGLLDGSVNGRREDHRRRIVRKEHRDEYADTVDQREEARAGTSRDWSKPHGVRTLQGRGRDNAAGGGLSRIYIFRPAYIYPVEPRKEPNFRYLLRAIYPAFRVLFPNQVIPADELGRGMVDVVVGRKAEREARIFENRDIRAMVKS
jgi:hypothetical protein